MIIIDAGHGGKDPGCTDGNILEKDLALKISLRQARLCEIYGIPYLLTRKEDKTTELHERTKLANKAINEHSGPTILISNHINSSPGLAKGFEIIKSHSDSTNYADRLLELVRKSDILAVRKAFSRTNNSGKDYFHMIREAQCRSYIIEWGFIKNQKDMASLNNNLTVACTLPIIAYIQDSIIQSNKK